MAGEQGKVRTGPQAGFQLSRLPVRPEGGQGQTHTRTLADLNRQDIVNPYWSGVPGPAVHVPHRTSNSHSKANPPRSTSYETHTVALEEQLEHTRITRKGYTRPQVAPPPLKVVVAGKQCASRSTITPIKTCSADIYGHIKRRVGHSLKRMHCKGNLVHSRKQVAHKSPGAKGGLSGPKRVPRPLFKQHSPGSHRQHNSGCLYQQRGGMKSGSLCAVLGRILSWCTRKQGTLKARQIPGRLNVIADKLSRLRQAIETEWSLHPEVFQAICSRWHQPQVDLFAPTVCVTGPRHPGLGSGRTQPVLGKSGPICLPTSSHLWQSGGEVTGLPLQQDHFDRPRVTQHALVWGSSGNVQSDPSVSAQLAQSGISTVQPDPAQEPVKPELTCLAPRATAIKEQRFSETVAARIEAPQRGSTISVYEAKWTIFTKWCLSNQVDFRAPPLKPIADFLLHLFQDRKFQPGTIDGYRSAIADKFENFNYLNVAFISYKLTMWD